jgi:hypothetical protein
VETHSRVRWNKRCTELLLINAAYCSNAEVVLLIEQEIGHRFSVGTVSHRRALLGLKAPRRNYWTVPLRRWRPW